MQKPDAKQTSDKSEPTENIRKTGNSKVIQDQSSSKPKYRNIQPVAKPNDPAHEIMVFFVLRKLIETIQTRMRSHPVGLDV